MACLLEPKYLETVACNLCGSQETEDWDEVEGFSIVRCRSCGLVYVNPRLNAEGLRIAYGEEYFSMHTDEEALAKRLLMYDIEIREIERYRKKGKILDVGCGGGYFLNRMGSQWEKTGTELNPVAADNARKKFGITVRVGNFPELDFGEEQYDVVHMRGVIEHFPDPFAYLMKAFTLLKVGGYLVINTPNIESLCARLYKGQFNLVTPKYHIYYFSPQTLSAMVTKAGFTVKRTRFFYFGTPYAKWTDGVKILADGIKRIFKKDDQTRSPAFVDNVLHLYASK